MPAFMDQRKEDVLLDSLRVVSKILGKEQDYNAFIEWVAYAEKNITKPSLEEIAQHTPVWIQLLSTPLGRLYDTAYDTGYTDATEAWKDMTRSRRGTPP
jgi:hypothetical protein